MQSAVRIASIVAVALALQFPLSGQAATKPDLVVSNINASPGKPVAGAEITLWIFVKNAGHVPAGASEVRVQVGGESNPPVIQVPALNPGQQFRYTRKVTFDRPGNYRVTVTADAGHAVAEANEGNNVRRKTIVVAPAPKPDLVVTKINYSPGAPKQHEQVKVWYFVKNIGQGKSKACYLSTTNSLNNYSIWHKKQVPALDPGREWRYEAPFTSNSAGTYYLRAVIDREHHIDESNEGNNTLDKKIVISPVSH